MERKDQNGETTARAGMNEPDHHPGVDELVPDLYRELRRLARWQMDRGRPGVTLQPTALVHEAYLRLERQEAVRPETLGRAARVDGMTPAALALLAVHLERGS